MIRHTIKLEGEAAQRGVSEQIPERLPRSLDELKPRIAPPPGSNGMEYVFGKWPGDETEEEVKAILEAIE